MRIYKTRTDFTNLDTSEIYPGTICTITDEDENPMYVFQNNQWNTFLTTYVDPLGEMDHVSINGVRAPVPIFSTDANGNVIGLGLVSGDTSSVFKVVRSSNVLKRRYGRACSQQSNTTSARTYQHAYKFPANVTAFRVGLENNESGTRDIAGAAFAVAETFADIATISTATPTNITWSSATTVTLDARRAANRPSFKLSDWIDCDVTAGQYLVIRTLQNGTPTWTATYVATGLTYAEYAAASDYAPAFWTANSDKFTGWPSWTTDASNAAGNMAISYIECIVEGRVVNIATFGDSTTVGQVDSGTPSLPPIVSACQSLSSSALLYSPITRGWGGLKDSEYVLLAEDGVGDFAPDALIYLAWSQNNSANPGTVDMQYLGEVARQCHAANIVPIALTGIPTNSLIQATDDLRKTLVARINALSAYGWIVIDTDAVISDGATPARYASAYGSGTHPNTAGYAAIVERYKTAIKRLLPL